MATIPTNPPTTRTKDWGAAVREALGDRYHEREVVYEFTGTKGLRKFYDSGSGHGIYTGTST